jgi:hypothetical protein
LSMAPSKSAILFGYSHDFLPDQGNNSFDARQSRRYSSRNFESALTR